MGIVLGQIGIENGINLRVTSGHGQGKKGRKKVRNISFRFFFMDFLQSEHFTSWEESDKILLKRKKKRNEVLNSKIVFSLCFSFVCLYFFTLALQ